MLLLAMGGLGSSSYGAPNRIATAHPPPPSMFFSCNSESKKCTCYGAENCIKLSNSGKCNGDVKSVKDNNGAMTGGECDWAVASRAPGRGPATLSNAPRPHRFDCYYGGGTDYCDCRDADDCKKLTDSKQCTGELKGDTEYKQCPTI